VKGGRKEGEARKEGEGLLCAPVEEGRKEGRMDGRKEGWKEVWKEG
jgi:hypothetical protein